MHTHRQGRRQADTRRYETWGDASSPNAPSITYLKFVFFRNRLENNSEHWNALFLSLRELAEWTVKKEAELVSTS